MNEKKVVFATLLKAEKETNPSTITTLQISSIILIEVEKSLHTDSESNSDQGSIFLAFMKINLMAYTTL